ncbi:helix-turn-helix domain-containing protein [Jannaschia aquimarina]|uniref:helix-turn-helix domain-containing protein n=1 Tax=Jannaschia aquimarina TaxID=935700 RepID=UPI000B6D9C1D|nr:AraC family transcriptional regulator [Jannaschia aquimarina]SNT42610.1 AraC-type DNA-binding protein [Jannaschia aquimarina]
MDHTDDRAALAADVLDAPPVFDTPVGASTNTIGPEGASLDLLGLSIFATAPGPVRIDMKDAVPALVIMPDARLATDITTFRIDGQSFRPGAIETSRFDLHAPSPTFELDATNYGWECLIEIDEARLPLLAHETTDGEVRFRAPVEHGSDEALAQLASLTIDHLRGGGSDRLYVEGLAIAMTARAFDLTREPGRPVPTRGTDARIARALDYAEAHLDESLSVAQLASAAGMSPSWFAQSFRDVMGKPVHGYVRERRLERARILLGRRGLPIQHIAYACGFSDQAHLTRAFKARFGVTPAKAREEMS